VERCGNRGTDESELQAVRSSRGLRIAIVGTGALGSTLLRLTGRRVQSVLLIDPDRLEPRNIALSPFFQAAMENCVAGSPKCLPHKAELLASYFSQTTGIPAYAVVAEIADVGWQDLLDIDHLFCCTDSALSRVETTYIARVLGKRMLDGGVFGNAIHEGRVSDFSPSPEAACYLCGMSEESRSAVLGYAASASLGCRVPDDGPSMTGTIGTLRAVANMMSTTPQHSSKDSHAVRLLDRNGTDETSHSQFKNITLTRSATCPWHDGLPSKLYPLPWEVPLETSMRELDHDLPARELQLAWPICTEAVCAGCGTRSQPFLRVASVRRTAICSNCGERKLQLIRAVHRIRAADPLSERSPRQLGLPDRHLYWLRDTAGMNGSCEGAT
jgi:molybdopterin/thiamine biosynthesis adenylyltransferase